MAEFGLRQDIFYTAYIQLVPTQLWKTLLKVQSGGSSGCLGHARAVARPSDP